MPGRLLAGRAALITGVGRGVGLAVADALAGAGASLCLSDLNPNRADEAAAQIVASGGQAFARQADISNKFQVAALIEAVRDRYSGLHILVHNAHVAPQVVALTMDEWEVRRTFEVNLLGAFLCAQLAGRVMADEGGGDIVLMVRQPARGAAGAAFAASQAGVAQLAGALAAELGGQGVRVHAVTVATPEKTARRVLALCVA